MSNFVFVLDTNRQQLTPCTPGMARSLLKAGKAAVFRQYPFTIILKKEVQDPPASLTLKLDPGSKTTGIALLKNDVLIWTAELTHRVLSSKMPYSLAGSYGEVDAIAKPAIVNLGF